MVVRLRGRIKLMGRVKKRIDFKIKNSRALYNLREHPLRGHCEYIAFIWRPDYK